MEGRWTSALCAVLVLVCCAAVVQCDTQCVARFGTCKYTSSGCSGGSFTRGLCNGPVDRQCCVPGGGGSCSTEVKNLACELFNSANVVAATVHPSQVPDNAYARNNLRDVCNGGKASRSSYTCNVCTNPGAPGGSTCLSRNLLRYLVDLKNNGKVKINEIAGACHSCQSRHYSGLAVDLNRLEPGTNRDRTQEYLSKCEQYGGWKLDEGSHIHCQFYDGQHPNW